MNKKIYILFISFCLIIIFRTFLLNQTFSEHTFLFPDYNFKIILHNYPLSGNSRHKIQKKIENIIKTSPSNDTNHLKISEYLKQKKCRNYEIKLIGKSNQTITAEP